MTRRGPVRLADDAGAGELGEAIRASRQSHGSSEQVARLAARMASATGGAAPNAAAPSGALSPLAKALLGGAVALSMALGLWLAAGPSERALSPSAPPKPLHTPTPVHVRGAPAPVRTPASDTAAPVAPVAPRKRPSRRHAAALAPSLPAPEHELVLLERSRAALDRDPALALEEAEAHARTYPEGIFAQEREVLAIDALLKLRRRAEAIARAERFVRRYPESSHIRRVRALLDREGLSVPATTGARPHDSTGKAEPERGEHEIER